MLAGAALAGLLLAVTAGCSAPAETEPAPTQPVIAPVQTQEPEEPLGDGEIVYEEGASPLSREQEAVIHTYMTRAYECLGRLEEPDFSDLFTDETQALASQSGIALQIGTRTLIDGVDYTLTGYHYTLSCMQTGVLEDGAVEMGAIETVVQNFTQLPGVDSQRSGNFHHFVLEEVDGTWYIRSHMQYDTLYGQLMEEGEGDWREADLAQAYIQAMPGYLEEIRAAQALREEQLGQDVALPQAEQDYDWQAALAYADEYAMDRNGAWTDYSSVGGNCQNYVSQCLLAGGIPMDISGSAVWKWYGSTPSKLRPGGGAFHLLDGGGQLPHLRRGQHRLRPGGPGGRPLLQRPPGGPDPDGHRGGLAACGHHPGPGDRRRGQYGGLPDQLQHQRYEEFPRQPLLLSDLLPDPDRRLERRGGLTGFPKISFPEGEIRLLR